VAAAVPTAAAFGGAQAPRLQRYDDTGVNAWPDSGSAERAAELMLQSDEARMKSWVGQGTVRSFQSGTRFELTQSLLDALSSLGQTAADRQFLLTQVTHAGINNLPKEVGAQIARRLGAAGADLLPDWVDAPLRQRAAASGYGNTFEASRVSIPWRPALADDGGHRLNAKPTAPGVLTATVVGPEGQTQASGADELHMDAVGRIRVQFAFQRAGWAGSDTSASSCWVRVAQPLAGAGMGWQFIPRIGQEVLVRFVGNDIDQPLVMGALYNGQGEAGTAPTPGGEATPDERSAFAQSSDHRPAAQGNLVGAGAGGHSPAWHGAAPGPAGEGSAAQANAGALSGFKTREFGGIGFNQLVFDDTPGQLRTQLASSQHGTQLNLGHLVHQADNHRGSFRGLGFELRTDAYGAVRAGAGVLISTYGGSAAEPAGDNASGMALSRQLGTLAQTLSQAATTHQTVALAAHQGSVKAQASHTHDQAAPLPALHTALSGMLAARSADDASADAAQRQTASQAGKLPHTTDPVIALSARAGLLQTAGLDLQLSAADTLTLAAGQHSEATTAGAMRIHSGQAIGVLAGAIQPGDEGAAGSGLTLIAAQGALDIQAQASTLQVAAKGRLNIQSAQGPIDWASAKKITLSTAGGANITLEGGNITVQCPGKITVKAGTKSFEGGEHASVGMQAMPKSQISLDQEFALFLDNGEPVANRRFELMFEDGAVIKGATDADGKTGLKQSAFPSRYRLRVLGPSES